MRTPSDIREELKNLDHARRASNGEFLRHAQVLRAELDQLEAMPVSGQVVPEVPPVAAAEVVPVEAPAPSPATPPAPELPELPVLTRAHFNTPQELMDHVTEELATGEQPVPQNVLNWAWSSRRVALAWEAEINEWVKPRLPLRADFHDPDDLGAFIRSALNPANADSTGGVLAGATDAARAQWAHDARAIAESWEEELAAASKTESKPEENQPAESATGAAASNL